MLLVGEWFVRNSKMSTHIDTSATDRYLTALADGMGGHNSGEVASSDVLHNLQFFFGDIPAGLKPGEFNEAIYEWLESINTIIDSKGHSEPKYHDMGTTLVAMAYYAGEYYWMNCGDSRLYRLHDGQLRQLTTDHSLSNLLGSPKHSNIITNCIGGGCKTSYIDLMQFTGDVQPGDAFLLCSDGLSDMLTDEQIARLLADGHDAEGLCDAAEEAGVLDNVSVIVIRVS
jgi:protein phosphatase